MEHMQRRLSLGNLSRPFRQMIELHVSHLEKKVGLLLAAAENQTRRNVRAGDKRKRAASPRQPTDQKPKGKQGHCGLCSWKLDRAQITLIVLSLQFMDLQGAYSDNM